MMKHVFVLAAVFGTLLGGCPPVPPNPNPPTPPDSGSCAAACSHLRTLGCEEGQPIEMGTKCSANADCGSTQYCEQGSCKTSCEVFCKETQLNGVWLNPSCVVSIGACSDIETKCYVGRQR